MRKINLNLSYLNPPRFSKYIDSRKLLKLIKQLPKEVVLAASTSGDLLFFDNINNLNCIGKINFDLEKISRIPKDRISEYNDPENRNHRKTSQIELSAI